VARKRRPRTAEDLKREMEETFDALESGKLVMPEDIWIAPGATPRNEAATRNFWNRWKKRK
jgi:hypothetical protein